MGCPSEVEIGDNLVFSITTHDPDTGVLTDADSAPSYRIYEDETGTAILTGTMAKLDDANTTGFYTESVAATSANGFENGKTYTVYITATVDTDQGGISYGFKAYDQRKANVTQWRGEAPNTTINGRIDTRPGLIQSSSYEAGAITASAIAAGALDGKGDWLLASSAPANFGDLAITVTSGEVTAGNMRGTDNALLASSAPANFSDLAITATTGLVDLNDKTGFSLTSAERNATADAILTRDMSNVEGSLSDHMLGTLVMAGLESSVNASGNLEIYQSDGTTIIVTKQLTTDANADPITGVS